MACKTCDIIYESFDAVHMRYPLCSTAVFARDDDGKIVFYVPCKNDYYETWFEFDYCPGCGKKITKE